MSKMKCPNCGRALQVPASQRAMHLLCPSCKHSFQGEPVEGIRLPIKGIAIAVGVAGILFLAFLVFHFGINTSDPPSKPPPVGPMSPAEVFAKASPAVVKIFVYDNGRKTVGQGSGFFVSSDGLLITNYHVIKDAVHASVRMDNKATLYVQQIVATAPESDLALLKVVAREEPLPHLPVAEGDPPRPGTKVLAIGSPQGLTNTLSEGLISAVRRDEAGRAVRIQTTAPISQGSSGGPLLTLDGQVVGVTTYYVRKGQNLNFAIPASAIRQLVRDPKNPKRIAGSDTQISHAAAAGVHEARIAIERGDWDAAHQVLDRLRGTQKRDPVVWFWYGYVQTQRGKIAEAIQGFRAAVALKPDFPEALLNLGINYAKMERHTEAMAAYRKAIQIDPDNAYAQLCMALSCRALRDYVTGIAACDKAIDLDPLGRTGSQARGLRDELVAGGLDRSRPRRRPGPRR